MICDVVWKIYIKEHSFLISNSDEINWSVMHTMPIVKTHSLCHQKATPSRHHHLPYSKIDRQNSKQIDKHISYFKITARVWLLLGSKNTSTGNPISEGQGEGFSNTAGTVSPHVLFQARANGFLKSKPLVC